MRLASLAAFLTLSFTVAGVADTGTPFPAGTKVEVGTPAGNISGTLKDRNKAGWISVLEQGRTLPTVIPEKSIGFIRPFEIAIVGKGALASPKAFAEAAAESEHYVFGMPRVTDSSRFKFNPFQMSDEEVEGHTILVRYAFTVGHYDKYKVPAWVTMRWTKETHEVAKHQPTHPRNFKADTDLPPYARTGKDYQHPKFGYERGHQARHEDLSGSGSPDDPKRATKEGCYMSNIVPQKKKGHTVWGKLEDEHHHIVANPSSGITSIWLVAGPIFKDGKPVGIIGPDKVGAPYALFKISAWLTADGKLTARGFIIQQEDNNFDLTTYLRTIDAIESLTGLDFFADMDDDEEDALESAVFTKLWQ